MSSTIFRMPSSPSCNPYETDWRSWPILGILSVLSSLLVPGIAPASSCGRRNSRRGRSLASAQDQRASVPRGLRPPRRLVGRRRPTAIRSSPSGA